MNGSYRDFKSYYKSRGISSSIMDKQLSDMSHVIIDSSVDGFAIDIYTKMLNDRIIFVNSEIDTYSAELIKCQLLYLDQLETSDIMMYINSPGGSVYDGLGIVDTIDYIKSDLVTVNTGLAASMASVLLCYGTKGKRKALKRSRTMIHQPLGYGGMVQQASDIEIDAKEINLIKKELYEILSERSGQSYKEVEKDGDRDYWLSSKGALDYGLIDEIIKPSKKK